MAHSLIEEKETQMRLELVKMSRELLLEEYINKRAEDHNSWLAESEVHWRKTGTKLPYPAFAKYPTDADIVNRAVTMYNFVNPLRVTDSVPVAAPLPEPVIEPIPELVPEPAVVIAPVAEKPIDPPPAPTKHLLPGWIPGWVRAPEKQSN